MPSTRFELEQQIMRAWGVVEDIQLVRKIMVDKNDPDSADNMLLGMEVKYEYEFQELFNLFSRLLKEQLS